MGYVRAKLINKLYGLLFTGKYGYCAYVYTLIDQVKIGDRISAVCQTSTYVPGMSWCV